MIRLTQRERWLAVGLAVFISAGALAAFVVRPMQQRVETLSRVIPQEQKMLDQLRRRSEQYLALQTGLEKLKTSPDSTEPGFELLAFVKSMTSRLGLAKKATAMTRDVLDLGSDFSETVVEVKLEGITLEQLVEFLIRAKSAKHALRTKSLYVEKSNADSRLLNTIIQICALKAAGAT
jgi:hypothetical protein